MGAEMKRLGLVTVLSLLALTGCRTGGKASFTSFQPLIFPTAVKSLDDWQRARNIGLTEAAKARFAVEFVQAARKISMEAGVDFSEVDRASAAPIFDYLDRQTVPGDKSASLHSLLGASFGTRGGFDAPEPRAFGRIKMTYTRNVEWLEIATDRMEPAPYIMSEIGRVTIKGVIGNRVVCQQAVEVRRAIVAAFTC